jgi:hypothetical protein
MVVKTDGNDVILVVGVGPLTGDNETTIAIILMHSYVSRFFQGGTRTKKKDPGLIF